jgi:phage recombination protein Bet
MITKTAEPTTPEKDALRDLAAPRPQPGALALPETPSVEWLNRTLTESQIKTITATVAPKATLDELAVFFWSCKRRGLDPFLKQVHFVKRRRSVKQADGTWGYEEYAVHQTGIDGFRVISNRAKDPDGKRLLAGIKRGPIRDKDGVLQGAWAEVYRHDWAQPARVEISFDEYAQRDDKGNLQGLWKTKQQTLTEKCAEAACHRMAFPEDIGDLVIDEEMDNAEHVRPLNRDEPLPRTSTTAAAERAGDIVDAEIVEEPAKQAGGDAFSGLDEAASEPQDPRPGLLAAITTLREGFKPVPTDEMWGKICSHFCGTAELAKVDPAALDNLRGWLADLANPIVGDPKRKAAITKLREIAGPKKAQP